VQRRGYWRAGVELLRNEDRSLASSLDLAPVMIPGDVLGVVEALLTDVDKHMKDPEYKAMLRSFCDGGLIACEALVRWARALCHDRKGLRAVVVDLAALKARLDQAEKKQRGRIRFWKATCGGVDGEWFEPFFSTDRAKVLVGERYINRDNAVPLLP
jgi:hypothetical protein